MNCVIQLRGLNASGKTTAMRKFALNNNLTQKQINVKGVETWVMTGGGIAVVGRYPADSNFGGCDTCIKGKQHLLDTLRILMSGGYSLIAFESFLFSGSTTLALEVNDLSRRNGYEYIAVLMHLEYNTELDRLLKRNGGSEINFKTFDGKRKAVYRSQKKLRQLGVKTAVADIENTPLNKMHEVLQQFIGDIK